LLDQLVVPGITTGWSWPAQLARATAGDGLAVVFQPIVDLQRGVVAGYEALARFAVRPHLAPDAWFAEARQRGRAAELDAAVIRLALAQRETMPLNRFLTINVEPASLLTREVDYVLDRAGDLGGVVLEITEHSHIDDLPATKNAIARLRRRGARIAVDDAGAGYAGLEQILAIRPDLLKVDRALVSGIEHDEAKAALVEMVGAFADRIDAWMLVEGIETEAAARRCLRLQVPLAQGWFFGRAQAAWPDIEPIAFAALADLLDVRMGEGL
jgi:EAL domain-containing protein (putative c-di-GMP-specific phosphodiesterase class I)